ncbi:similar to Saccharomyces cerevisiae YOR305W RRG7 Protein of unknown function [Maudiozyma saulgeensis]|uniref:Required for respiratory growth protein 7, mitochondrial n=1 Tax=Maudiozyma saulgeensis TaxID=1789683 RepID=A0A1X7R5J0_9SACH|nr:similar to Saccharomyces cerevisiae YOR305W RRG7 Protein of unknown function [Kazachstania saulgeensis]
MRLTYVQVRKITNAAIERYVSLNKHTTGSTVFQGTLYENIAMREMSQKLGMINLERVGGAHDGGVDVTGDWSVVPIYKKMERVLGPYRDKIPKRCTVNGARLTPIASKIESGSEILPLRALVQCKAFTSSKVTPKELRELVGTFGSLVTNSNRDKTVVIMCSPHLLTKDSLKLINGLRIPLIYLRIEMLQFLQGQEKYDFENSGKLINYFENEYAMRLLQGCRIDEWVKYDIYNKIDSRCKK